MSAPDPIKRMAQRVAQCRRLADTTGDERTAAMLRQMADEGEQDLRKLLEERDGPAVSG